MERRLSGLLLTQEGQALDKLSSIELMPLDAETIKNSRWIDSYRGKILALGALMLVLIGVLTIAFRENTILTLLVIGSVLSVVGITFGIRLHLAKLRRNKFVEQLPEAIDIIIRGARVGISLQENFQAIAREMQDPIGHHFRILAEKLSIGIDLESALNGMAEDIGVKELQFLATTLVLQRRTGGQYAEVLENLSKVLRDRQAQFLKAKALTSEARVSARIVMAVTVMILGILALTNKAQFDFLLDEPAGHNLLIYAVISIAAGFFSISRLLRTIQ